MLSRVLDNYESIQYLHSALLAKNNNGAVCIKTSRITQTILEIQIPGILSYPRLFISDT
jgi:hypothetical protein